MSAALLLAVACGTAVAQPVELAQKLHCMACHAVERKVVGPAFKEVAARHAGQADAADRLATAIVKGSSGQWGGSAMPPNPTVTTDEARQLAGWVLSLRP